jgi:hypothetical protein
MSHFGSSRGFGSATENGDPTSPPHGDGHIGIGHTSIMHVLRGSFDPDTGDNDLCIHERVMMPGAFEATEDNLAPARGIILAAALSAPFWAIVSLGAYALFH